MVLGAKNFGSGSGGQRTALFIFDGRSQQGMDGTGQA